MPEFDKICLKVVALWLVKLSGLLHDRFTRPSIGDSG